MEENKVIEGTNCKVLKILLNATNSSSIDNKLILFQDINRPYITFILPEQVFTSNVNFTVKPLEKIPNYELKINGTYRHFKGNNYKILAIAYNPLEKQYYIIYKALYGQHLEYCRSLSEFISSIDINRPENVTKQSTRFKYIGE